MSHGIKTAGAICQCAVEKTLLEDIKNKIVYLNDICLGVATQDDVNFNTKIILDLLKEAGMTINSEKCIFKSPSVKGFFAFANK